MGGILSSPKTPKAPDPVATAEAQAKANQVTQFTPQGNLIYGQVDPATGQFNAYEDNRTALKVEETPFQESLRGGTEAEVLDLLNAFRGSSTNLGAIRTPSSFESNLTPFQTDFSGDAQALTDATFQAATQRLQPQFDEQRGKLEQRLADQGLPIGSEAYQTELNRLEESQNEQLSRLSLDSVAQGRAEQDRLARLQAALRGQQFNEQIGLSGLEQNLRGQQFGELGSLLGFNTPFTQQQINPVDVAGITNSGYQNQLAASQMQNQGAAQQAQALGTIGGFLLSDLRLKEGIKPIGKENGYNIYEFNYIGDDRVYKGVMAQEVEKINPSAVTEIDGYKAVNYDAIGVEFKEVAHV